MMKITGGAARGTVLSAPKGLSTRPTLGRVRESIFNVLANVGIIDTKVLDIFAGTGAMGLEALSRGAAEAVFIDKATARFIRDNARKCGVPEKISILTKDVHQSLRSLKGRQFDYIFMDPPYDRGYVDAVLKTIFDNSLLADDGIIAVEHIAAEPPDASVFEPYCVIWKEKKYSETAVTYLCRLRA